MFQLVADAASDVAAARLPLWVLILPTVITVGGVIYQARSRAKTATVASEVSAEAAQVTAAFGAWQGIVAAQGQIISDNNSRIGVMEREHRLCQQRLAEHEAYLLRLGIRFERRRRAEPRLTVEETARQIAEAQEETRMP